MGRARRVRLLLDTNALIWLLNEPDRLSSATSALIEDDGTELWCSVVSVWEVAIKHRIGKLDISAARALNGIRDTGADVLPLKPEHLLALQGLPRVERHNDPFDHIILAQAMHEGLTLVTSGRRLAAYGVPLIAA